MQIKKKAKLAKIIFLISSQWDEGGGRILLGDKMGSVTFTLLSAFPSLEFELELDLLVYTDTVDHMSTYCRLAPYLTERNYCVIWGVPVTVCLTTTVVTTQLPLYEQKCYQPTSLWQDWYKLIRIKIPSLNRLKPTSYVIHQQFNIQQLYVLPTLYLCVLYLYENKQRFVPLTA